MSMSMSASQLETLHEMFADVHGQVAVAEKLLTSGLVEFPQTEFPVEGTQVRFLAEEIGRIASIAAKLAERSSMNV